MAHEIELEAVLWWVAVWFPIVIGATTAIVLGKGAMSKGPNGQ